MKWQIPSKTFLLGEYAAVAQASAIIITTKPYFELRLTHSEELAGIHPESPAGLWWQQVKQKGYGLHWSDPYEGLGGLGASSAQFLGSYLASVHLQNKTPNLSEMLKAYYQSAWSGIGLRPSGYDVIAQLQQGCVYINKQHDLIRSYSWPFEDLSFLLVHTRKKLATHHHLQNAVLPDSIASLSSIVDEARDAFENSNSEQLIHTVNSYHQQLKTLNLVAPHSLDLIERLKTDANILAIKGCGALGADVLLLITSRDYSSVLKDKLKAQDSLVVATEADLA